ncbi:MAG: hypothetical protein WA208_13595 [Thermoanaerobaculia bacterium]
MLIKKIGIAAALTLCAVGAMASNFRAADQVYLAVAGKVAGGSGTFISDVFIANLSTDSVQVSVLYSATPSGSDNPSGGKGLEHKNVISLAPGERKTYVDFFPTVLNRPTGFGQLIFNACLANADCGPATQNSSGYSPNFRNISVQSRIYSIPPGTTLDQKPATTGQLFSGIPWYNFASSLQADNKLQRVFISGLTQNGTVGQAGTYRANIGAANASQFSTTDIVFRLYAGNAPGTQIAESVQTLAPLGHNQWNFTVLFPGQTGSNFFVTVEQRNNLATSDAPTGCVEGCPAFIAYGSILDNVSGDATTLEPQYEIPLSDAAVAAIYPAGSGKGAIRRSVTRR